MAELDRFDVETWFEDDSKTVALVVLQGLNSLVRNNHSLMTYQIISGAGTFKVGSIDFLVGAGDVVSIPKGMPYQDEGDLMMIATAEPRFDTNSVEAVEPTYDASLMEELRQLGINQGDDSFTPEVKERIWGQIYDYIKAERAAEAEQPPETLPHPPSSD